MTVKHVEIPRKQRIGGRMPQELASKVSHTPGPWDICGNGDHIYHGLTTDKPLQYICTVSHNQKERRAPARDANARLIAAAPEMLEALELYHAAISAWRTTGRMPDYAEWVRFFDKGEAAIRKARGGE